MQRECVGKNAKRRRQGIDRDLPQPPRRSARLQAAQERTVSKKTNTEPRLPLPSSTSSNPGKEAGGRNQNQLQEPEGSSRLTPSKRPREEQQTSPALTYKSDQRPRSSIEDNITNPIDHWRRKGNWPPECFIQDDQTRKDLRSYIRTPWLTEMALAYLLAKRKPSSALRGIQSDTGLVGPGTITVTEQKAAKITPYSSPAYVGELRDKGSFLTDFHEGIDKASSDLCQTLLHSQQTYPQKSLFDDDVFMTTCQKLFGRNEAMVCRDITQLIVPPAQTLATHGATHLDCLVEGVSEGWHRAEPLCGPCPHPDYSVGFGKSAFTEDQLAKLKPFVGKLMDSDVTSHFMATWQIYFPFLTSEVTSGTGALNVADLQNAHSMTLAVRGVVGLFKLVKREKELHRNILSFSISHDDNNVRIYGHYPIINGDKTTFYRYTIKNFSLTAKGGKKKWAPYRFTKNVYNIWMPTHLERICSVIDKLPDLDIMSSQQSTPETSGLSRELQSHNLTECSNQNASSPLEEVDSQSDNIRDATLETFVSHRSDERAFKRQKKSGRSLQ